MSSEELEIIAKKSNELLERQINSKRSVVSNVGTILGISSVYIGIYLLLIEQDCYFIIILSFLPIILFIIGYIKLIQVLNIRKLYQGFNQNEFVKLIKKPVEEIYKFEIAANKKSISNNDKIVEKIEKFYKTGLNFISIGFILSLIILFIKIIINNWS